MSQPGDFLLSALRPAAVRKPKITFANGSALLLGDNPENRNDDGADSATQLNYVRSQIM